MKSLVPETKYELRSHEGDLIEVELDASGRAVNTKVVVPGKQKPAENKDVSDLGDFANMSTKDLKNQVRDSFDEDFKNKLFQDLTDEQLKEFMIDYKNRQNEKQMSISPGRFLERMER